MIQSEKQTHSISKNSSIVVASFSGALSEASKSDFEMCIENVLMETSTRFVILDFSKVDDLSPEFIPSFVNYQMKIRQSKEALRIYGLGDSLKAKLLKLGVLRQVELTSDLRETVMYLGRLPKKKYD